MKILFIVSNLKFGGMQKSLINLTNELIKKEFEIHIQVLSNTGELIDRVNPNIKLINSNKLTAKFVDSIYITKKEAWKKQKKSFLLKLIHKVFKEIRMEDLFFSIITSSIKQESDYDVVISYTGMPGIWDYITLNKYRSSQKIAWIHNWPDALNIRYENSNNIYEKYQGIVNVSKACKTRFDEIMPNLKMKSYVVYNLFDDLEICEKANENDPYANFEGFKIVTVGRVECTQKKLERILDVVEKLNLDNITNFKWYIVGDGPDRKRLEDMAVSRGLEQKLVFVGYQSNPYRFIKHADLFVITSDFEGYCLVLIEAFILKTVSLSTSFDSAKESVIENKTGMIVEKNVEGIYLGIKKMIEDKEFYKEIKDGLNNMNYSKEVAIDQFLKVIEYTGKRKGNI